MKHLTYARTVLEVRGPTVILQMDGDRHTRVNIFGTETEVKVWALCWTP